MRRQEVPEIVEGVSEGGRQRQAFTSHLQRVYGKVLNAELNKKEANDLFRASIQTVFDYIMRLSETPTTRRGPHLEPENLKQVRHLSLDGIGRFEVMRGMPRAQRVVDPETGAVSFVPDPEAPEAVPRLRLRISSRIQRAARAYLIDGEDSGEINWDPRLMEMFPPTPNPEFLPRPRPGKKRKAAPLAEAPAPAEEEAAPAPAKKPAKRPAKKPVEAPAEEPIEEEAAPVAEKPVAAPAKKPAKKPAEAPAEEEAAPAAEPKLAKRASKPKPAPVEEPDEDDDDLDLIDDLADGFEIDEAPAPPSKTTVPDDDDEDDLDFNDLDDDEDEDLDL